ncbi:hypothetical protein [Ferruginibacter sp.]
MLGSVYQEDHQVTDFKIFDKSSDSQSEYLKSTHTILNKSEKVSVAKDETNNIDYLLFSVTINATNKLNGEDLSKIQVTSNYLLEYNKLEQIQIDMACGLVERSVQHCHNLYIGKVSDTHLKNDTISIPKNLKSDCIKQRLEFAVKN